MAAIACYGQFRITSPTYQVVIEKRRVVGKFLRPKPMIANTTLHWRVLAFIQVVYQRAILASDKRNRSISLFEFCDVLLLLFLERAR